MPCSALMLPPSAATASWTRRLIAASLRAQERAGIDARRRLHVVVQVAVAQVAEVHHAHAGECRLQREPGGVDETRDRRDRQRDVVLHDVALRGLGQRDRFAQLPQRPRLRHRRGQRGVGHQRPGLRGREQGLELRARVRLAVVVGLLEQHRPRRGRQRSRQVREVVLDQRQRDAPHQLEAGEGRAEVPAGQGQQPHAVLERGARGQHGAARARLRMQLERGRGDHAQRALAADVEVAQVVAGVVLAQAAEPVPDLAVAPSPPPGPGTARGRCRSAAPGCRRRWSRGCRRWCNCPRTPRLSGNSSPASSPPAAPRAGGSRLRR